MTTAAPAPAPAFTERYLLSPEMVADPYPYLDALREHAPCTGARCTTPGSSPATSR